MAVFMPIFPIFTPPIGEYYYICIYIQYRVCNHEARKDWIWLPSYHNGAYRGMLRRQRYCKGCGTVKGNGRSIGFFINALGVSNLKISKVQRHLIVGELHSQELFTDPYGSTFEIQAECFSRIVERHSDYPAHVVISNLNWPW